MDIVAFEKARPLLLETWGFDSLRDQGGRPIVTVALFWGAQGTGKSAAAEALGFEFGRALKVVNFPEALSQRAREGYRYHDISYIYRLDVEIYRMY